MLFYYYFSSVFCFSFSLRSNLDNNQRQSQLIQINYYINDIIKINPRKKTKKNKKIDKKYLISFESDLKWRQYKNDETKKKPRTTTYLRYFIAMLFFRLFAAFVFIWLYLGVESIPLGIVKLTLLNVVFALFNISLVINLNITCI